MAPLISDTRQYRLPHTARENVSNFMIMAFALTEIDANSLIITEGNSFYLLLEIISPTKSPSLYFQKGRNWKL